MIGETISHYKIIEKLGEGGMGVVYKALDTTLDRFVAIKFLPPHLSKDEEAIKRFMHEAKAASALDHSHIGTIFEVDKTPDGRTFIVMAYYEGETLRQRIDRGAVTVEEAITITSQIASGLAKAHAKDIVHRDIKPSNILITRDRETKIIDFGLAKLAVKTRLTKEGSTLGTAAYMSPEQAKGEETDHRSDIFSLGAVLHELLTGEPPFRGKHEAAILYEIVHEEPERITAYRNDIPEKLETVIDKSMQKSLKDRYSHMTDMLRELDSIRSDTLGKEQSRVKIIRTARRYFAILGITILVAVIAYIFIYRYLSTKSKIADAELTMLAVLPFENLGPPEDEYFADGVTEEVMLRLGNIRNLGVIARFSSMQYKNTEKTIQQIGEELQVEYILAGTVRWQKSLEGSHRVRVNPQLIRVADATHVWAESYDNPVAEVFQVQSEIASRVAEELDIVLFEGDKDALESIPTDNFDAYTHYLHGRDYQARSYTEANLLRAEKAYKKAIEMDAGFALAYARLSQVHAEYYWQRYERSKERAAEAKDAADKAWKLMPDLPETHIALGTYYYECELDYNRALEHYEIAARGGAERAELLANIGFVQRRQGKWLKALENIKRASELDPSSALLAAELGGTYYLLRDYLQAERFYDRAISLDPEIPDFHIWKTWLYLLWDGNTGGAREALRDAREHVDEETILKELLLIVDILDEKYEDALKLLSSLTSETVGAGGGVADSYIPTFQYYAEVYKLMGKYQMAQSYYDSARVLLEGKIRKSPDDPEFHSSLGIAFAGLGRKDDAIREGRRGVELLPISKEAITGYLRARDLAMVYMMIGDYDAAVDQLENLLSIPGELSAAWLRNDPRWNPIRQHSLFQRVLEKYNE